MKWYSRRIWRIILYTTQVAAVIFLIVLLIILWAPSHTQVSCKDPSIGRPYRENTVSPAMLFFIGLGVPFFVTVIGEWVFPGNCTSSDKSPFHQALHRGFRYTAHHFVGSLFTWFLVHFIKIVVLEPRPHFLEVCGLNFTQEQCQETYVPVTLDDCTNPYQLSQREIEQIFTSFPSGHAALSTFTSVFLIVYLQQRLWRIYIYMLVPWLQLICAFWAVYCSQSRIWDDWHHWWDVLAGVIIGVIAALLVVHNYSNWFDRGENLKDCEISFEDLHTTHSQPTLASRPLPLPNRDRQDDQGPQDAAKNHSVVSVTV